MKKKALVIGLMSILLVAAITAGIITMTHNNDVSTTKKEQEVLYAPEVENGAYEFDPAVVDTEWYDKNPNANEFVIENENQFVGFLRLLTKGNENSVNFSGKTIKLGRDLTFNAGNLSEWDFASGTLINLADYQWDKPNVVATAFQGTLDGQGQTISGIYLYQTGGAGAAIIPRTADNAVIKNISIINSYIEGSRWVSGLIGEASGSLTVAGVNVEATLVARKGEAGALAGTLYGSTTIRNSTFNCNIESMQDAEGYGSGAGGVAGSIYFNQVRTITLENVLIDGNINGVFAGGIIGSARNQTTKFNLNLKRVAVAANVGGTTCGTLIGGYQTGDNEQCVITNDFDAVYTLDNDLKELGQETLVFKNNSKTIKKSRDEMLKLVTGYKGYNGSLGGAETLKPDVAWYTNNMDATEFVLNSKEEFLGFITLVNNGDDSVTFAGKTVKLAVDVVFNKTDSSKWNVTNKELINLDDYQSAKPSKITYCFQGIFDGQGHTVSGISSYSENKAKGAALILFTGHNATIKNLKVVNSHFENVGRYAGGLIGQVGGKNTLIEDVYVEANVIAGEGEAGGLVGDLAHTTTIRNATVDCHVASLQNENTDRCGAGGLIGTLFNYTTQNLLLINNVQILGTVDGVQAGGVIGTVRNNVQEWNLNMTDVAVGTKVSGETSGRLIGAFQIGPDTCGVNKQTLVNEKLQNIYVLQNGLKDLGEKQIVFKNSSSTILTSLEDMKNKVSTVKASMLTPDFSWYDENAKEYIISTKEEFLGFVQLLAKGDDSVTFAGKVVKLANDIVFNSQKISPNATPSEQLLNLADYQTKKPSKITYGFQGTFDGQGHILSGMCIYNDERPSDGAALFLFTGHNATIKNVSIVNSYMGSAHENGRYAGGLIGQIGGKETVIENVYIQAGVHAQKGGAGGLAGDIAYSTTVKNCIFDCVVEATQDTGDRCGAGGLAGTLLNYNQGLHTLKVNNVQILGTVNGVKTGGVIGTVRNNSTDWKLWMTDVAIGAEITGAIKGSVVGSYECTDASVNKQSVIDEAFLNVYTNDSCTAIVGESNLIMKNQAKTETTNIETMTAYVSGEKPELIQVDTSWYIGHEDDTEYTLTSKEAFLGFMQLIAQGNESVTFDNKIVKLGTDIELNTENMRGIVLPSEAWVNISDYQIAKPEKVGYGFQGTFDGQDHTISGACIYNDDNPEKGAAFFLFTGADATIKNLKVTNSYMGSDHTSGRSAGSLVGVSGGALTIKCVKVETDVHAQKGEAGGLVGSIAHNATIQDTTIDSYVSFTQDINSYCGAGSVAGTLMNYNEKYTLKLSNVECLGSVAGDKAGILVGTVRNSTNASANAAKWNLTLSSVALKTVNLNTNVNCLIGAYQELQNEASSISVVNCQFKRAYALSAVDISVQTHRFETTGVADISVVGEDVMDLNVSGSDIKKIVPDTTWYTENTSATSYELRTVEELAGFMQLISNGANSVTFAGKTISLMNDIVVNTMALDNMDEDGVGLVNLAEVQTSIPTNANSQFRGTFEGNNYSIIGLYLKRTNSDFCALFPSTGDGARIQNLKLKDAYISGNRRTGGLVGHSNTNLTIDNVKVNANIRASKWEVGGLIGELNQSATINNTDLNNQILCTYTSTTDGANSAGGVVGNINSANPSLVMNNVVVAGTVESIASASQGNAGGIIGLVREGVTGNFTMKLNQVDLQVNPNGTKTKANMVAKVKYGNRTTLKITDIINDVTVPDNGLELFGEDGVVLNNGGALVIASFDEVNTGVTGANHTSVTPSQPTSFGTVGMAADTSWYDSTSTSKEAVLMDAADLLGFVQLMNKSSGRVNFAGWTIKLGADIVVNNVEDIEAAVKNSKSSLVDLASYIAKPAGKVADAFQGVFDGQNHTISGVYSAEDTYTGFITTTGNNAVIKNLKLTNSYISSNNMTGALVGVQFASLTIENVTVEAVVASTEWGVGGLIGCAQSSSNLNITIKNVTSNVKASSRKEGTKNPGSVGGLIGTIHNTAPVVLTFQNVLVLGTATADGSNGAAGGLIGLLREGKNQGADTDMPITMKFSDIAVKSSSITAKYKGNLIGRTTYGKRTSGTFTNEIFERVYVPDNGNLIFGTAGYALKNLKCLGIKKGNQILTQ